MKRGFTMVEVIVAAALLGACVLLIVGLVPSGVLSLKKAEDLQAASAYALQVLEFHRKTARPDQDEAFDVALNQTQFHVHVQTSAVPAHAERLADLCVTMSWNRQPAPLVLATRVRCAPPPSPAP